MYKNTWQYKNKYLWQILEGNTHDLIITLFLQDFNQTEYSETCRPSKIELFVKIVTG